MDQCFLLRTMLLGSDLRIVCLAPHCKDFICYVIKVLLFYVLDLSQIIFIADERLRLTFFKKTYPWMFNHPITIWWHVYPSSVGCLFCVSQRSVGHVCTGRLLGSLLCSIDLCVYCFTNITQSVAFLEIGRWIPPTLLFFKMFFVILFPYIYFFIFFNLIFYFF